MKKIRNIDFRKLKDSFFDGINDEDTLYEKAVLIVLYEHTSSDVIEGMPKDELMEKAQLYAISIVFEANKRKGHMEIEYDEHGMPNKARLTDAGTAEAKKIIKTALKKIDNLV